MGQKVNPIGLRLGIVRSWDSLWFEGKQYKDRLHEDLRIRQVIDELSRSAGVSRVQIERRANQVRVMINTAKPGIIIGKRGAGIEDLRKRLERVVGKPVNVNVIEIKHPELDAKLVANNIIDQLEKRIAFRRAMRQAIQRTMKAGARGIKVQCGGRLGGAEIARVERNFEGKVPLHTLRANIDYAQVEAYTTYGRIGVKVWIYLGEVLPDGRPKQEGQDLRPRERRPRRADRAPAQTPGEAQPAVASAPASGAPSGESAPTPETPTAQAASAEAQAADAAPAPEAQSTDAQAPEAK